ncbi:thiosulfate/3-mercaptopyruvate sulfurtransferase [Leucobacter exalbidus]|uniref:Thiosulfate/3-mercaptopyruvate sulfurtransferase n=1 Tax=Leucobacter exalbidus TaxID=662960 RepID=A0A940PSW0_9MICO|nr:sulfurtransferase [Leucobacter exalbidus]MBP1326869.1 thiosulfate/3-mercaptopyruvate sulfurtransferase [Leucobacter exalbidus]
MTNRDSILITVDALQARLESERDFPAGSPRTRLLDVRWTMPQPDGREAFAAGHLPGAVYVDLDTQLAQHKTAQDGRHPLPDPADFQAAARSWGLNDDDEVVVYDGGGNYASARAWWLLLNAGFGRVRLLDGALPAWVAAGGTLETGSPAVEPGDVTLSSAQLPAIELTEVEPFVAAGGKLIDARAAERYAGIQEPIDPRAGHIPGAVSAPTGGNLTRDGFFLPGDVLRARFSTVGVDSAQAIAAYCGSGVTATHTLVALALAGFGGALFPGSWSQWSNHDELPVATGELP